MTKPGLFYLSFIDGNPDNFIVEHREELRALCAEPMRANSATIAGIYVEYRPPVDAFSHVVSVSRVG